VVKKFSEKGNMKTHYKTHTKCTKKKFVYTDIIEKLDYTVKSTNSDISLPDNKTIVLQEQYSYIGKKTTRKESRKLMKIRDMDFSEKDSTNAGSIKCDVTEPTIKNSPSLDNYSVIINHPQIEENQKGGVIFIPDEIFDFAQMFENQQNIVKNSNSMERLYEGNDFIFYNNCQVMRKNSGYLRYDTLFEN